MAKVVKPKAAGGKRKGKYQMPDPIPNGEVLTDLTKQQWKLGPSIGKGGFGEIYSATEVATGKNSFVVKIEPKENGPLFVEMHFFMKVCKTEDIGKWMTAKKLKFLGLPRFIGNGSHTHKDKPYRFIVMEKLGNNLDSMLQKSKGVLQSKYIFQISLMILDALEYIHSKGYVHADIKAGNLLLGTKKGTEDQVYLVDFGLASKYSSDFKPDPKCAHNGTIEFTSRDAHVGATTRRGDLEILAYNMLQWFTSRLPWENKLTDCVYVQQQKLKYMKDIPGLMEKCFGSTSAVPTSLTKYFNYVSHMAPTLEPDYDLCRSLFKEGLKASDVPAQSKVSSKKLPLKTKINSESAKQSRKEIHLEVEEDFVPLKKRKSPSKVINVKEQHDEEVNSDASSMLDNGSGTVEKILVTKEVKADKNRSPAKNQTNRKQVSVKSSDVTSAHNNKQSKVQDISNVKEDTKRKIISPTKSYASKKQEVTETKPLPVRPMRAVRALTNGYMDETISFSDSDDSDVVYSPPKPAARKKVLKRKSDDSYSPKKKIL